MHKPKSNTYYSFVYFMSFDPFLVEAKNGIGVGLKSVKGALACSMPRASGLLVEAKVLLAVIHREVVSVFREEHDGAGECSSSCCLLTDDRKHTERD